MPEKKLITICIPVFNEEENIPGLIERLQQFARTEASYDFEFLFTDNRSNDDTFAVLSACAMQDKRVRVLRFSRNFGFQKSILTNYLNARGDAAVQIDADLQDPPEMISQFLRQWENGYKVVYGVRRKRQEGGLITALRRAYYRTLAWLSEIDVPVDAGDFRLIDRVIIEHLRGIQDQTPYLRGIISNLGYPQLGIPYDRDARTRGSSKFNFYSLITLGLDGVTSQSTKPLRIITLFGFSICLLALLATVFYVVAHLFSEGTEPGGFTTLVVLVLSSIGLNALFIGLLGEYIGRIFNNARGLPISIIEQQIDNSGIDSPDRFVAPEKITEELS